MENMVELYAAAQDGLSNEWWAMAKGEFWLLYNAVYFYEYEKECDGLF